MNFKNKVRFSRKIVYMLNTDCQALTVVGVLLEDGPSLPVRLIKHY